MDTYSELDHIRGFAPIVGREPRVLILGTAPSEQSLRADQYYANPRNDFWTIMDRLFSGGRPLEYPERVEMLKAVGVALWDVLLEASRVGSLDADIRSPVPNDLGALLRDQPSIHTVFFNGSAAESLFSTYVAPSLGADTLRFERLPSTSPANASISFALKLAAWDAVRVAVTE
jgi:hypoxanthine-DNA glycosylase